MKLDNHVNNSLNNLTPDGKKEVSFLSAPSNNNYVAITMPASTGGDITAPANGTLCLRGNVDCGGCKYESGNWIFQTSGFYGLYGTNCGNLATPTFVVVAAGHPIGKQYLFCSIPVAKGNEVKVYWNKSTDASLWLELNNGG